MRILYHTRMVYTIHIWNIPYAYGIAIHAIRVYGIPYAYCYTVCVLQVRSYFIAVLILLYSS